MLSSGCIGCAANQSGRVGARAADCQGIAGQDPTQNCLQGNDIIGVVGAVVSLYIVACLTHQYHAKSCLPVQGLSKIVGAVGCPNRCRLPATATAGGVRAGRSTSAQAKEWLRAKSLPTSIVVPTPRIWRDTHRGAREAESVSSTSVCQCLSPRAG